MTEHELEVIFQTELLTVEHVLQQFQVSDEIDVLCSKKALIALNHD